MSIHRLLGPSLQTALGENEYLKVSENLTKNTQLGQAISQVASLPAHSPKEHASKADLKRELKLAVTTNREAHRLVSEVRNLHAQIVKLKAINNPSPEQVQEIKLASQTYETILARALVKVRDAADILSGSRLPSPEEAGSLFKRTYTYYQQRVDGLKNTNKFFAFFKARYYDPRKSTSIGLVQLTKQEQNFLAQHVAQLKSVLGVGDNTSPLIDLLDQKARNAFLKTLSTDTERDALLYEIFSGKTRYVLKAPQVTGVFTDTLTALANGQPPDESDVVLTSALNGLQLDLDKINNQRDLIQEQAGMSIDDANKAVDYMVQHPFLLRFSGLKHKAEFSRLMMLLSTDPAAIGQGASDEDKQVLWQRLVSAFPDCKNERVVEQLMYKAKYSNKPLDPAVLIFLHCPTLQNLKHPSDGASRSRFGLAKQLGIMSLSKEERRVHKFYHGDSFIRWPFLWITGGFHNEELHFLHAPGHMKGALAQAALNHRRDKIGGFAGVVSYFFNRTHPDVDLIHHEEYKVNTPDDYDGGLIKYSDALASAKRAVPNKYLGTRPTHQRLFRRDTNSPLIGQRQLLFKLPEDELDELANKFTHTELERAKNSEVMFLEDDNPTPRVIRALKDGFLNFLVATNTQLRNERGDGKSAGLFLSKYSPKLFDLKNNTLNYDGLNLEDPELRNGLQQLIFGQISGDKGYTTVELLTKAYKLIQQNQFVDATPVADHPPNYDIPQTTQPAGTLTHVISDTRVATLIVDSVNELAALAAIDKTTLGLLDEVIVPKNPNSRISLFARKEEDGSTHNRFAGVSDQEDPHTHNYLLRMANHAYHLHLNLNEIKRKVSLLAKVDKRKIDEVSDEDALINQLPNDDKLKGVVKRLFKYYQENNPTVNHKDRADQHAAIKVYSHMNVDEQPHIPFGTNDVLFDELIKRYGASTNDQSLRDRAAKLNSPS